jgi:hypothetical protein
MSKLSEHILEMVRNKTSNDEEMRTFLLEVLYLEADQTGKYWWHFKDKYKKLIERHSRTWRPSDENYEDSP